MFDKYIGFLLAPHPILSEIKYMPVDLLPFLWKEVCVFGDECSIYRLFTIPLIDRVFPFGKVWPVKVTIPFRGKVYLSSNGCIVPPPMSCTCNMV